MFVIRTSVLENAATAGQLSAGGVTSDAVVEAITTNGKGWIAEINGRPVGFSIADRRDGSIFALYVLPQCEGQGLGTELLSAAVEWLSQEGLQDIWLAVGAGTRAHRFYLRRGWRPTGSKEPNGDVRLELNIGNHPRR